MVNETGIPESLTLPQYSAYKSTTAYALPDGTAVFGLLRIPLYPDNSDLSFTVDVGTQNRLDLVSYNFYGTPQLWWAISALNQIIDPLFGVPVGTLLRIPLQSRIPTL